MIFACGKIDVSTRAYQLPRHRNVSYQFRTGSETPTAFFAYTPSGIFDRAALDYVGNGLGALASKVVPLVRAEGTSESVLMSRRTA